MHLLANTAVPPGYELLATVRMRADNEGKMAVFARLYKVSADGAAPGGIAHGDESSISATPRGQAQPTDLALLSRFHVQQIAADHAVMRNGRHRENVRRKLCGYGKKCKCGLKVNRYSRSSGTMT